VQQSDLKWVYLSIFYWSTTLCCAATK